MKNILFVSSIISQCFLLNCRYSIQLIDSNSYQFGSKELFLFYFDNSYYDYYVFVDYIDTNKRLDFDIYSSDNSINSIFLYGYYHSTAQNKFTPAEISNYIDMFYSISYTYKYETKYGNCFSFYAKDLKNNYFYLAIHMPDSASLTTYPLNLYSEYYEEKHQEEEEDEEEEEDKENKKLGVIYIVLIIFGSLIVLAGCSMGVAKMMGRSPLDGLLCFFILCTICCIRHR